MDGNKMLDKLIVMLTHNDQTVQNAQETFDACQDLPVKKWGFKDVGLAPDKMTALCQSMKRAGKETFLEVVTYTEAGCLRGAKLAVECGFDYLMGTILYDSVVKYARENGLKYLPFVGDVSGSPSVLKGSVQSMVEQTKAYQAKGVYGVDLLGYRYVDGDPEKLSAQFIENSPLPTVLAGSIASIDRLRKVQEMNPWLFTMGSALFKADFVPGGSVRQNLSKVVEILESM
ncbi:hypothetical protein [Caproiciproducens sp.]